MQVTDDQKIFIYTHIGCALLQQHLTWSKNARKANREQDYEFDHEPAYAVGITAEPGQIKATEEEWFDDTLRLGKKLIKGLEVEG